MHDIVVNLCEYMCIFVFRTHMHQMFVTLVSQPDGGKFSRNSRREVK